MLSRFMRLLVLSLILLSLASPGFAARRSSLGGNLLIKDMDDIFFLPQRVVDYNRTLTFDYGSTNGLGSGGMIFGNERITFGAFAHRSDFLAAIPNAFFTVGDMANISSGGQNDFTIPSLTIPGFTGGGVLGSGPSGGPYQWIDVLLGFQGGETPLGVRLSVGRNQMDPVGDDNNNDVTSVDVVFGATVRDIEWSGEVSFATAETQTGVDDKTESSPVGFAVSARKTATEESEDLQVGWLGSFAYATGGTDQTVGGTTTEINNSMMLLSVGLGPVYMPTDRTTVAMYGTFDYLRANENDANSDQTGSMFVIPGWKIAGEIELASWLQWRGGLVSRYAISKNKVEPTGGTSTESQQASLNYNWHTGVGFTLGDFKLDGYIDPSVITSGTDLLGNSSDLFGMVTASYGF